MRILELTDRQTFDAAVIEDRRILAAVNEERTVRSMHDAVRAFLDGALDSLAMAEVMIEEPVGGAATRRKWEGKSKWGRARHSVTAQQGGDGTAGQ